MGGGGGRKRLLAIKVKSSVKSMENIAPKKRGSGEKRRKGS